MNVILEVISGPDAPRSFAIEPGTELRVGRAAPAKFLLANDPTVSRVHFAIGFDGKNLHITDLGSTHGTTVNGSPIDGAVLADGDLIVAGTTALRVRLVEEAHASGLAHADESGWPGESFPTQVDGILAKNQRPAPAVEESLHERVLGVLRAQQEPIFAIIDAARDPMVYLHVIESPEQKQSLYEGPEASRLSFVAPYLSAFTKDSPSLEKLVREGWGKAWGIYLTCGRPFDEVRRHLRHFLKVKVEGKPRELLFRFYDPRVLRVFLPTCTPGEAQEFCGPIVRFLLEGEDPSEMLDLHRSPAGVSCATRAMTPGRAVGVALDA